MANAKRRSKNKSAVSLGRAGGSKKSKRKTAAARANAALPPRPGKRGRGRPYSAAAIAKALRAPFIVDPVLAKTFGGDATFKLDEVLKGGRVIAFFSRERFAAALTFLQSQAAAGGPKDRTAPDAVHVLSKEFKPEIDAIEAFLRSGKTKKKIGELTVDDVFYAYHTSGRRI